MQTHAKSLAVWRWLVVLLGILMMAGWAAFAAEGENGDELPPEPPWYEEPGEDVTGDPTEEGIEFEIPFLGGLSTFLAEFFDCQSGEDIEGTGVHSEYYFRDGAEPPYELGDLERVVIWVPGYQPATIDSFEVMEIPLLFMTISVIVPAEGAICLMPAGDGVASEFFDGEEEPDPEQEDAPLPPPTPTPSEPETPGQCNAYESERKVWKVVYHPAGVDVERLTKPNGGLETRFTFHFDREQFYKMRERGPCTLEAGHDGAHSPWSWSKWRKDGSETTRVSTQKTIGGWPEAMSASYFERWVLGFCWADLTSLGLSHLRYIVGSFDPNAYYDAYIKDQLK